MFHIVLTTANKYTKNHQKSLSLKPVTIPIIETRYLQITTKEQCTNQFERKCQLKFRFKYIQNY